MAAPAAPEVPAAGSCRVPGWQVFGPGYHKGQLYTAADCKRMVSNFAKLSSGNDAYVKAKGKLGHDSQQRLAQSLGYPSCGTITAARLSKNGMVEIDLDDVPLGIGSEINAGRINDGSVELDFDTPDPADPSKTIQGPVLTGVAFLGEEQPAVKGCPPPKAVLPDKSIVPQGEVAAPWLAQLFRQYSATPKSFSFSQDGRTRSVRVVRFSEVIPVRDQLLQTLGGMGIDVNDPAIAGMTDEQLQALVNQMGGENFTAKMKAKFADPAPADPDPKNPPSPLPANADMTALSKSFADFSAAMTNRMGAMEQAYADFQKAKPEMTAAVAFSKDYVADKAAQHKSRCEREVDLAITDGKVIPADKLVFVNHLIGQDATRKFSATESKDNAGKTPFEVEVAALHARPKSHFFSQLVTDPLGPVDPTKDPFIQSAMKATAGGRRLAQPAKS